MQPVRAYLLGGPKDGDIMTVDSNVVNVAEPPPLSTLRWAANYTEMEIRKGWYIRTSLIVYQWKGWE